MPTEQKAIVHDQKVEEDFHNLYVFFNRSTSSLLDAVNKMINNTHRELFATNPANLKFLISTLIEKGVITPRVSYLSMVDRYDLMIIREGTKSIPKTMFQMFPHTEDLTITALSTKSLSDTEVYEMISRDIANGERFEIVVIGTITEG
jgi:hypothetical protein